MKTLLVILLALSSTWPSLTAQEVITARRRASSGCSTPGCISGLQAWYAADSGTTCTGGCTSGNFVTAWNDKSANANNLSCTSCAVFETAQLNSKPAIQFDGSANFYSLGSAINLQTASTIFAVVKAANTGNGLAILSGTAANALLYQITTSSGKEQTVTLQGVADLGSGTAAADTSWHQMNMSYSGTSLVFRIGEAADGTVSVTNTVAANETSLGFNAEFTGGFFNGDMAEIIIYNRVLTSGEKTIVETYLNGRYAI